MHFSWNKIIVRFVLLLLTIVLVIFINYWHGKKFHPCKTCSSNEVVTVRVPQLPDEYIKILEHKIRTNGSRLNPELNFSNAQGRKLNFTKLPECVKDFYENDEFARIASEAFDERVTFAPISEQYRIFSRLYEDDDDFLDWHYDNNFTKGKRYTLVIPVMVDECNTSEFMIKDRKTEEEILIPVQVGQGVIYNGTDVYHKITQQTKHCRRMVIIIPFYSNYEKGFLGDIRQFMRNVIYQQLTL